MASLAPVSHPQQLSMQRYWWPRYVEHLVRELQRQQNASQFCDTLLQAEGISVPTHSCVLAALSPQLSERLSGAQPSPLGQRRKVRLDSMTAQTLLKLVGLLYSGEVEVKGSLEKDEVLYAARQFGITDLVEGRKDVWGKEGQPREDTCRKLQGGHFETGGGPVWKTPGVSVGTQTADVALGRPGQSHPPLTVPSSPSGARGGHSSGVCGTGSHDDDLESQIAQEHGCRQEDRTTLGTGPSETAEQEGTALGEREEDRAGREEDRAGREEDRAIGAEDRAIGAEDRAGREEDRAIGAEDRAGREEDRAGREEDRAIGEEDRAGGEEDRAGGAEDRAGREEDRAIGEEDRAGREEDRAIGEEDRAIGEEDRAIGAEDRAGGEEDRAIGEEDRAIGEEDRAIGAEDRAGGEEDRAGGEEDRAIGAEDRAGREEDRAGGEEDRAIGEEDRAGGAEDRAGREEDRAIGEEDRAGREEDRAIGEEDRAIGEEDRAIGAEDRAGGEEDRAGGEEDRAIGAEDRAGREEDRAGGEEDRAGGEEDRAGGEEDRAGGEEDRAITEEDRAITEEDRATVKQMLGTTRISFKLKLVRTEGKAWEVLRRRDARETLTSPGPRVQEPHLPEPADSTPEPKGQPVSGDPQVNGSGGKALDGKRKRPESEEIPEIPPKKMATADPGDGTDARDGLPAGAKADGRKRAQVVNVKDAQRILKQLFSKTRKLKGRQRKDATRKSGNLQSGEGAGGVPDTDVTGPQTRSRRSRLNWDSNHNHILGPITPREEKLSKENISAEEDVLLSAGELQGTLLHCVPRRRGQTGKGQRPKPPQNSEGAPQLSVPRNISASLTHHRSSSQTPSRSSRALNYNYHQEEEEVEEVEEEEVEVVEVEVVEEEEEEVDILRGSPLPLSSLNGNELLNISVFPEEEEEEEEPEIDVMGD